jgi:hypothetical protein
MEKPLTEDNVERRVFQKLMIINTGLVHSCGFEQYYLPRSG